MKETKSCAHHPGVKNESPVRVALLSFFTTLLSFNSETTDPAIFQQNVRHAAAEFERVANEHYDAFATRSDAIYARFVTILNYISVTHLYKLCEGFRTIHLHHAYHALNSVRVQHATGVEALRTGCEEGVIPVAISYRHSPHEINNDMLVIPHATVDSATAERFTNICSDTSEDGKNGNTAMNVAVVWIDRAVKGLSVDGEWYVRGLLPYALVPIVAAHRGKVDFARPWIWLEWRLSTRAFSTNGLYAMLEFRETLLIALEALFEPSRMLENYEYREEMEAVVQDMFVFGLLGMVSKSSVAGSRLDSIMDWSDYKVGLSIALACQTSGTEDLRDIRFGGQLVLDDRDPYGCGLFREGLELILSSSGMEMGGSERIAAYAMVDGNIVVTQRIDDKMVVHRRVSSKVKSILDERKGKKTIRSHLREEVRCLQRRYDLCNFVDDEMFGATDELSVLAACHVELPQVWKQRECARDDAYATVSKSLSRKAGLIDEEGELRIRFDKEKALVNARRRERKGLRNWVKRMRKRQRGNCDESEQGSDILTESDLDPENEDVRMWLDYNCGSLRWVTPLGENGEDVVFRRMRFRRDSHRSALALRCVDHYVPKKALQLLARRDLGLDPTYKPGHEVNFGYCHHETWVLREV